MLAPSKRRVSFYTLPIVVVIGFLLVAGLAAWRRADVVADLADKIAHGDSAGAAVAVRQLAAMPSPPMSMLVDAAASDEHATAEAGQVAINHMLAEWQRDVDQQRGIRTICSNLMQLAEALAGRRHAFPPIDYPWLLSATRRIMQLANQCPAEKTPLVAMHCDAIMSVVGASSPTITPVAGSGQPTSEESSSVINTAGAPAAEADSQASRQAMLEHDFSGFPSQPALTGSDFKTEASQPENAFAVDTPASREGHSEVEESTTLGERARSEWQRHSAPSGRLPPPNELTTRPDWSQPIFRILPAMPMTKAADDHPQSKPENASSLPAAPSHRMASNETHKLFERWQTASGNELQFVEHDLATRGFKHIPKRLVEQYLSDDVENRLRLVDAVLTEPGLDSRPWLLLLADDENAEVRLLAVTVMATSDDRSLVEKAWQVAIRDRDPRIADLAGRLRDRRAGVQRR